MTYSTLDVPVRGGTLRVGRWDAATDAPTVFLAHGITANHVAFRPLAEALGAEGVNVIAPDLRGRGRSNALPAPYSSRSHAEDAVAVLDALGVTEPIVFGGHSGGGFAGLLFATVAPERVRHLLLLDGGPRLAVPEDLDIDVVLQAVIGPAMARLEMTFPSLEAYLDYWRPHPAVKEAWGPTVEEYLRYDLVGEPPEMRSSVSIESVRGDAMSNLTGEPPRLDTGVPTTMLRAERGLMNEPGGLYPLEAVQPLVDEAGIPLETIHDVNHYSMIWLPAGIRAIVDAAMKALTG
jgi:pimeloyl-ACP methyl ester carboxylesterase